MNFQQTQHNEESDYEYDDERSLQTDDLSYLSSSYDTEDEHDDDVSLKIGGNIMMHDEELDEEEEGEMEMKGGETIELANEPYMPLHNRSEFRKLMKFTLSNKEFKKAFIDYINTGDTPLITVNNNMLILLTRTKSNDSNNNHYFKNDGEAQLKELYKKIYGSENENEDIKSVLNIKKNSKVFLSNDFAIKLMFCLTHFINDGCTEDGGNADVPNHKKFKKRYEYRALFTSFIGEYYNAKNDESNSHGTYSQYCKTILDKNDDESNDDESTLKQQQVLMKYLLILIAFETDNMPSKSYAQKVPGVESMSTKGFIQSFIIPQENEGDKFNEMLKRILSCFSIDVDVNGSSSQVSTYNDRLKSLLTETNTPDENSDNKIHVWIKSHLYETINFYYNMEQTSLHNTSKISTKYDIHFDKENVSDYFNTFNTTFNKHKLKNHISTYIQTDGDSIKSDDEKVLIFLEYVTGKNGGYFYNNSLPIIPYSPDTNQYVSEPIQL